MFPGNSFLRTLSVIISPPPCLPRDTSSSADISIAPAMFFSPFWFSPGVKRQQNLHLVEFFSQALRRYLLLLSSRVLLTRQLNWLSLLLLFSFAIGSSHLDRKEKLNNASTDFLFEYYLYELLYSSFPFTQDTS